MSIIQNKFSFSDRPHYEDGSNGYFPKHAAPYDNNNLPRSDSYYLPDEKTHSKPTFLFWTLVVFLFILAVGNLMLTFIILGVLRLGQGMESIELLSEENLIKFYGSVDLDKIYKRDGHFEGFADTPMEILSNGDSVLFRLEREGVVAPSIDIGVAGEAFHTDSYEVHHPLTGLPVFSTNYPNFGLPRGVVDLHVEQMETKRIESPLDSNISIKSDNQIILKGIEGTYIDGKEVVWSADQDIFLKSVNKSIILSGHEGVYIDVNHIRLADTNEDTRQFKICVCMPSGRLFRVPVVQGREATCVLEENLASEHPCL